MTGRGEKVLPAKPPAVHALADMMEPSVVPDIRDPELESEMMEHPGALILLPPKALKAPELAGSRICTHIGEDRVDAVALAETALELKPR